jgi:hypothetical protein
VFLKIQSIYHWRWISVSGTPDEVCFEDNLIGHFRLFLGRLSYFLGTWREKYQALIRTGAVEEPEEESEEDDSDHEAVLTRSR